jgi:signal transduction histidine kinase
VYCSKIQGRNIVVDTVFDTLRPVHASRGELTQVLSNVVANAIDAMPNGGTLRVRVNELDPEHLRISVEDDGYGIAPENLRRVFEPFFTTKGNLGTGIGLWVSKKLIEKHHGDIVVCSRGTQTRGTCVCISLPFGDASASVM